MTQGLILTGAATVMPQACDTKALELAMAKSGCNAMAHQSVESHKYIDISADMSNNLEKNVIET